MRSWLGGKFAKVIAIVVLVVGCASVIAAILSTQKYDPTRYRWFMNASTNPPVPFQAELVPGTVYPIKAPSGGNGYPAETCFWTADGKIKDQPTYVLLNSWVHKSGPTFCPDCGRLVVPHNPAPMAGDIPPPTRQEYFQDHPSLEPK
jgi:hypothetical protein